MTPRLTLRNLRRSINLGQPIPSTPGLMVRPRLFNGQPQGWEYRKVSDTRWYKI